MIFTYLDYLSPLWEWELYLTFENLHVTRMYNFVWIMMNFYYIFLNNVLIYPYQCLLVHIHNSAMPINIFRIQVSFFHLLIQQNNRCFFSATQLLFSLIFLLASFPQNKYAIYTAFGVHFQVQHQKILLFSFIFIK